MPAGTQPGTKFRLRERGIKPSHSALRGDQYVTVLVDVPRKVTDNQKELLRQFDAEYIDKPENGKDGTTTTTSRKKSGWDRFKDKFN